jgi:DNA invertase Pin-like site-specific DNA recombinase
MQSVCSYLRVSTVTNQSGHGFQRQAESIQAFCKTRKLNITRAFKETWTGTDADRPVLSEMLDYMVEQGIDTFVVESSDRFARDLMVQFSLLAQFHKQGIHVLNASTGEDMTACLDSDADPIQKSIVQIQSIFSELEKRRLVSKLKKARDAKSKEQGQRIEGRPKDTWDEDIVLVTRSMRSTAGTGGRRRMSLEAIASRLNQLGHRTPRGTEIKLHNVQDILRK